MKEREEARNEYDDALAAGHGAYLSEKKEDGIFSSSIGSLPAGKEVSITIEYVTELEYDGNNSVRFRLMMNDKAQSMEAKSKKLSMSITVDVQMSSEITEIRSDSHELEEVRKKGSNEAKIKFGKLKIGEKEVKSTELCISISEAYNPTVNLEQLEGEKEVTAALSFHPDLQKEESMDEVNTEFVFLVDCSGSMAGAPINAVKETLHIFLRSLPESCYFNIVDFGSKHRSLFVNSSKYSDYSLQKAIVDTDNKKADLGGT